MLNKSSVFVSMILAAGLIAGQSRGEERELIQDKEFQRGFILWKPEPGKLVGDGELKGVERDSRPAWGLYQWSTRFPLGNSMLVKGPGDTVAYKNEAKTVSVGSSSEQKGTLSLAVNSSVEYGPKAKAARAPWVHLLVQQDFDPPAALDKLGAVKLHIESRLLRSRSLHDHDYSPDIHSAQFTIFFTVENRNSQSAGNGDYLWFGVPIYDNRSRFPKAFKEQDFGGTARYIFMPDGKTYTESSAHDAEWMVIEKDLLPLMHQALEAAWARGFLKDSKKPSDYSIGGMNMGWEVPGTFDVEMQIRNFSVRAISGQESGDRLPKK